MKRSYTHWDHAQAVWKVGVIARWAGGLWLVYGFFAAFRDDFLDPALQAKYKGAAVVHVLLSVPVGWWVAIALLIAVAWIFEATFAVQSDSRKINGELTARLTPGFKLTLFNAPIPDGIKILAGWYLRIDAINASDIFQVFLDLNNMGGGFRTVPKHLISATWDDGEMPARYIVGGTHACALITYREVFEQGFTPKIRGTASLNQTVQFSGDSYGWDDVKDSKYSIRVSVSAANAQLTRTFTINFCGRDVESMSGDVPDLKIRDGLMENV